MQWFKAWLLHRAKAFVGAAAAGVTGALLEAAEQTFNIQLGSEAKLAIIGAITHQAVYWTSNGEKEGTA